MSRLGEFSTILGLFINVSSVINKVQSEEGGKIINLLETGEGIALIIVVNVGLILIHRSWFLRQWKKFRGVPFLINLNIKIRNPFFKREPLILESGAHTTDLSFLDEETESYRRWPKNT